MTEPLKGLSLVVRQGQGWRRGWHRQHAASLPTEAISSTDDSLTEAKTITGPDPDGPGPETPRTDEVVYDGAGRVVASRRNAEPWSCRTYDARGRLTSRAVPAHGASPPAP